MQTVRAIAPAIILTVSTVLAAAVQTPGNETLSGARNYTRVDATVACGGATDPAAFAELKRRGFVAVVNLRLARETGANVEAEAEAVSEAGLKYFHLPMDGAHPTADVADRFLGVVTDAANQPVYIHCASANRVGSMWLIKRVLADGWDVDEATQEAEAIGLRSPTLKQFSFDYIASHRR